MWAGLDLDSDFSQPSMGRLRGGPVKVMPLGGRGVSGSSFQGFQTLTQRQGWGSGGGVAGTRPKPARPMSCRPESRQAETQKKEEKEERDVPWWERLTTTKTGTGHFC